jgi:3-phosphoshikimate 1-carboxyvinyltransferase
MRGLRNPTALRLSELRVASRDYRMSLPELIEIEPPESFRSAVITVPGSKSITNRALVLAALAEGEVTLRGALWSEDTQVMVDCLQEIGFMVTIAPDPAEPCNRTITVYGKSGAFPRGGSESQPMELFVGNAGTAARFLAALVCLGTGVYRLHGVARMHERPQGALFSALSELGYRVDATNDRLPALIHGGGPRPGRCTVSIEQSSQFASALMLSAAKGGWRVQIQGENAEESPYVRMTESLLKDFPHRGGEFQIEPDASSGSYFIAVEALLGAVKERGNKRSQILVPHWPASGWQIDGAFPAWADRIMNAVPDPNSSVLTVSRSRDLGDSIMTAVVLAPFARVPVTFTDLGRLRLQECERVQALRTELEKCGARVCETGDTLTVSPSELYAAEIETYDDHRMAMCFALVALAVPGTRIRNPDCVKKTFPNFFQKLATAPPEGLGVGIRNAQSKKYLVGNELFAE